MNLIKNNKSLVRLFDILERFGLPIVLNMVVMNIIFSAYQSENHVFTAVMYFAYQSVLFLLFEWLKPKKILRGIIYTAVLFGIICIGDVRGKAGYEQSTRSFIEWFYLDSRTVGTINEYFLFLFFCLGFFITSVIYYFTVIRYRTFGTMLVLLFPFLIYGKRADTLSAFNTTLMLTVFLAMLVHNKQVSDDTVKNTKFNLSYVMGIAIFVTFSAAVASVLPNPNIQSQLEQNNEFFNFYQGANATEYDTFSNSSSPRYGFDTMGDTLFYVSTTENTSKLMLRRQSYDEFQDNKWIMSNDEKYAYFDWEEKFPNDTYNIFNSPQYVYNLMKSLAQTGRYQNYGLTTELFESNAYQNVQKITYYSEDFYPRYIPAPLMIKSDETDDIYRNNLGNVTRNLNKVSILDGSFSYIVEGSNEKAYAASLTLSGDEYLNLLNEAYQNGDITQEDYETAENMYSAFTYVDEEEVDIERIQALTDEVIKDCTTEYQKAKAIEQYFEDNNYIYDLEFWPDDESVENFLFNTKTGTCSSYATSMTLMCRLAGLPARYVEGFAAYESTNDYPDSFVVKDSDAHAFVEVYIAGSGWVTFDPTVSGYERHTEDEDINGGLNTELITAFFSYFSRMVLFLGAVFVLVFIVLIQRIVEVIFRIRIKFANNTNKVLMIYRRIIKLLELSSKERLKGYTPNEIQLYCLEDRSVNITAITQLFDKTCFGGYNPTNAEFAEAYKIYKQSWKYLIKKPKIK